MSYPTSVSCCTHTHLLLSHISCNGQRAFFLFVCVFSHPLSYRTRASSCSIAFKFFGFSIFLRDVHIRVKLKKNDIHKRTRIFWCYGSSHRFLFILPCVGFPFSLIELTPFRLRTPPKTLSGHTHISLKYKCNKLHPRFVPKIKSIFSY